MRDVPRQLGNYQLIREIGRGGFATVYLAKHLHLKHYAAVKVLTGMSADTELFRQEAQTIMDLSHQHIVRVFDFGIEHDTPFLVMEYAPYGSLRLQYPRTTVVPIEAILSYTRQVAAALQYAHQQRIIHRDIKPENMLIGKGRKILLSDFGIALMGQSSRTRDVAGTTAYMAPEQILGKPRLASDQYALAITVYEWLCGRVPFTGTAAEITAQHLKASPPSLRAYAPTLSAGVEAVILRALEKEPDQRFPTVLAFASALVKAAGVEPRHLTGGFVTERTAFKQRRQTQAIVKTVVPRQPQRPVHRRRVLVAFTGLIGIGSIVGGIALFRSTATPTQASRPVSTPQSTLTPLLTPTPTPTSALPAGTLALSYQGHTNAVYSVAFSPNGRHIASGGADQTAQVWDANNGMLLVTYRGHRASITYVAFSPDGTRIATASDDMTVQVWDAVTGKTLFTCVGHSDHVHSAAWSPDGKYLASGSNDTTVRLWDANSGMLLMTYRGHQAPVWDVSWSPDGTHIASASDDYTVKVWTATGATQLVYKGQDDGAIYVAFSPNGKRIASGSFDGLVHVWDATTGNTQLIYAEHDDTVYGVVWSPDGTRVASGSVDKTVQVWDATTGNTQFIYKGHSDTVFGVVWSPDGMRIASASADKTVQVWQA